MFTKKQKRINWILVAVLLVLSIFFLFPVIWMLANSFKPDAAITADMNSIAAFIPPAPGGNFFDNYVSIITDTSFLRYMGNTLLYAAILIVLSIVVNGLAGYALAKIKFPFRDQWLMIIIMLLIVPTETVITIHFLIIAKAGLLNTIVGYILPMIVTNALGVALFGMFLAIIIPPARENRVVGVVVIVSFAASYLFSVLPGVSALSDGTRTIILTIVISAVAALLFPVKQGAPAKEAE